MENIGYSMWHTCVKILYVSLIFAAGVFCGFSFPRLLDEDEYVITNFTCPDDVTDNYALIRFDDIGKKVSYNAHGHWSPYQKYWINSIVHSDHVVVWESQSCFKENETHLNIASIGSMNSCAGGNTRQASEMWFFERTAGHLSRFRWSEDGSIKRYDQYCNG